MEDQKGAQRLSVSALKKWEQLGYGMFLHFGLSTFDGEEFSAGKHIELYCPENLNVDQWIATARDAGMKYAVLTAKHASGFCLWPSKYTKSTVAASPVKTDVVERFVEACAKYSIMPGLYYCSWDNFNRFGSVTWSDNQHPFTTREYMEFQTRQVTELLTQYGKIGEVWIDIPAVLPRFYREELYRDIARMQPEAVIMMNNGFGDGSQYPIDLAWPADIMAIERWLPNSQQGHVKWRDIVGTQYYFPAEVCDPIGKEWFFQEDDRPRSDAELLGMYLVSRSRGANLLLDVPPDRSGTIPRMHVEALMRLRRNIEKVGGFL